jgi:hypothetical protein
VFIELIVTALVIAYVAVLAVGHVLLIAAIFKCLRQDSAGGHGRKAAASEQERPEIHATRRGAARPVSAGAMLRLVGSDVEHPQHP